MELGSNVTQGFPFLTRRQLLQLTSILAYIGSLFFQDRVLRYEGAGGLEGLLTLLTLSTTLLFCNQGFRCLQRGWKLNLVLYGLSVMVVASTLLTLHGQKLTSTLTRVLFKSAKVIPTSIFEGFMNKRWPSQRKIKGCAALVLGSLIYFVSTESSKSKAGEVIRLTGIIFLLMGTVIDSALTCLEEYLFFRKESYNLDVNEVAFGCSMYGILSLVVFTWMVPVFENPFADWTIDTWDALKWNLIFFCGASALSYVIHFIFISSIGSLYADSFKAFRKIVAVVVFGAMSKGFTSSPLGIIGVAVCAVGLYFIETGYNQEESLSGGSGGASKNSDTDGSPRYIELATSDSTSGLAINLQEMAYSAGQHRSPRANGAHDPNLKP